MTMYQITAHVMTETVDGYSGGTSLPTFFLDGNIQGILTEARAVQVAEDLLRSVVDATGRAIGEYRASRDRVTFHVGARRVEM